MDGFGKCERCGRAIASDDYLCESCRSGGWETRYEDDRCGNCQGYLQPGDKYCRLCGTKAGEGAFEPWRNVMQCVYGPMPMLLRLTCGECGYAWKTEIDDERYCPRCGHAAQPDRDAFF